MRALSPNRHSLLGSLTLSLGLLSLTACTADHKDPADPPEINTYNAYVNNNDHTINYYVIKNDTLSTRKIADFTPTEEGFQNVIFLDVDEDKQGFEYIAYVTENSNGKSTLNLFDLDKANSGKHYQLASLSSSLCGISANTTPAEPAFELKEESNLDTKNKPEIVLQLANSGDCSDALFYEKVDFSNLLDDDSDNDSEFERTVIPPSDNNQTLIINYASGQTSSFVWNGDYGHLSYNDNSSELSFSYTELDNLNQTESGSWSTQLPYTDPLSFQQVSNNYVLFQQGKLLYVKSIESLFTVDDIDTTSVSPVQDGIDSQFSTETFDLKINSHTDWTVTVNPLKQSDSFVIKVENNLYLYHEEEFTKIRDNSNDTDNTTLTFLLNSESDTLLLTEEPGSDDLLSIISSNGEVSSIEEAEHNTIASQDDTFYFNSYNINPGDGNQAHMLTKKNGNFERTTFDNSTLIHVYDMTNEHHLPLLISSEPVKNVSSTRQLSGHYLYKFDEDEDNGRALAQSSRKNENGKTEHRSVDFSYGIFNGLEDITFLDGLIINDYYGLISFNANYSLDGVQQNADFSFVFNPNQDTPDPDIEDQSLSLLLDNSAQ